MPLRPTLSFLFAFMLAACSVDRGDASAGTAGAADITPPAAIPSPRTAPADAASPIAPSTGPHHGNWRLVAADDPHDAALMAFSIQSDAGATQANGDFVLFQPFCDAVADAPIVGDAECELIGLDATFDRVEIDRGRVALTFHPTADGLPHRLELQVEGDALTGHYVAEANGVRRAVIARRPPADAT